MKILHLPGLAALPLIVLLAPLSCSAPEEGEEETLQDVTPHEVLVTDFSTLVDREWKLVNLCGERIPEDAGVSLVFLEDDRVAGSASVNRYNGSFRSTDAGIEAGPMASTRMAGPPEAMEREQKYLAALADAKSVSLIGGDVLVIAVENQELPLRFEAAETP